MLSFVVPVALLHVLASSSASVGSSSTARDLVEPFRIVAEDQAAPAPEPVRTDAVGCGVDYSHTALANFSTGAVSGEMFEDVHLGSGVSAQLCRFDIMLRNVHSFTAQAWITFYSNTPTNATIGPAVAGPFPIDLPPNSPSTLYHVDTNGIPIPKDTWVGMRSSGIDTLLFWRNVTGDPSIGSTSDSVRFASASHETTTVGGQFLVLYTTRGCGAKGLYAADAADNSTNLYLVDPATGAGSVIGDPVVAITGLDFHPGNGTLFGSTAVTSVTPQTLPIGALITLDPHSGAPTLVGSFGLPERRTLADISFDPTSSVLYGWISNREDKLYTVNTATGHATLVGGTGLTTFTGGMGLAFNHAGTLYLAAEGTSGMLRTINKVNAQPLTAVQLSGYAIVDNINSLAFDECGVLYGVTARTHDLIRIDTGTGAITTIGPIAGGPGVFSDAVDGIAFPAPGTQVSVPTPPTRPLGVSLDFIGPNPNRSDALVVSFTLSTRGSARLELLDLAGRRMMSRELTFLQKGSHRIVLPGVGRLPAGAYLARLTQGEHSVSKKFTLLR